MAHPGGCILAVATRLAIMTVHLRGIIQDGVSAWLSCSYTEVLSSFWDLETIGIKVEKCTLVDYYLRNTRINKALILTKLVFRSKMILFCYQTIMMHYAESLYRVLHPQNTPYPKTHNNRKCDSSQVAYIIVCINKYFWTPW